MTFHSLRKNYTRGYLGTSVNTGGVFDIYDLFDENIITPEFIGGDYNSEGRSDFTLSYPSGIVANDLMIIASSQKDENEGDHPTAPVGWNEESGTSGGFTIYTKFATGSESGTLTMINQGGDSGAALYVLRNASSTLIDFDWLGFNEQTPTSPPSIATASGQIRQIHLIGWLAQNPPSPITPSGYTLIDSVGGNAGGASYWKELTTSGSTGVLTVSSILDDNATTWSIIVGPSA